MPNRSSSKTKRSYDEYRDRFSSYEYTLTVLKGPHKGDSIQLTRENTKIGRAEWCELSLFLDGKMCHEHCELVLEEQGVRVRDLNSRGGTWIGDHRVVEAYLKPDAVLCIGRSELELSRTEIEREIRVSFVDPSRRLVGKSEGMRRIFDRIYQLRMSKVALLLTGETGTGKTSVARALHETSPCANGPFISVNCGALENSLINSMLFGHERGAFTGANQRHIGYVEQANQGTLFLDEIGELSKEAQVRLLDVLERKRFHRLGGTQEISSDFRLLCATHRSLRNDVQSGRFRRDLYYRISVVELPIPALRERLEDLDLLCHLILQQLVPTRQITLSPDACQKMQLFQWPGNVRQLRNALERAIALKGPGAFTTLHAAELDLPIMRNGRGGEDAVLAVAMQDQDEEVLPLRWESLRDVKQGPIREMLLPFERELLRASLEANDWNVKETAYKLGQSRSWLHGRIKKFGLSRRDFYRS